MSLPRRSSYYKPNSTPADEALMDRIGDICVELSRYGYRRVADITSIRILPFFVYLAVMLDALSRRAIGYALSKALDIHLTLDALRLAICNRHPMPSCIHHSDHEVQYASGDSVKELLAHGFQISMSRKANPRENARAGSFIKTP